MTGFGNSTCLLLRVAGRWTSTSLRALIREKRQCSGIQKKGHFWKAELEMRVNDMLLIYIGTYTHKYMGHEIANWWGWGGHRSEHCRRCGQGVVGQPVSMHFRVIYRLGVQCRRRCVELPNPDVQYFGFILTEFTILFCRPKFTTLFCQAGSTKQCCKFSLTSRRPRQVFLTDDVPDAKKKRQELLPREEELVKALYLQSGRESRS